MRRLDRAASARLRELEPRIAFLDRLGIFATATRPVLERLAAASIPVTVPAGEIIVREGDPADALFAIVSGSVEVTSEVGPTEPAQSLRTMGPGSYFGEIGVLEQIPRTATVTALTTCELYRIDAGDFRDALTELPLATTFLDLARTRLARTHPTRDLQYDPVDA